MPGTTPPPQPPRPPAEGRGADPAAPATFEDLLSDCVHCGFCLPTCPTYVLWGEEMDSPRGRIHLMGQSRQDGVLTGTAVRHFDNCLGCLACVSACPSGVRYDALIETARADVEREHERPLGERLLRAAVFALFPYRGRLRLLRGPLRGYQASGLSRLLRRSGLLDRLPPSLAAMERLAPPLRPAPRLPERVRARGRRRATVGMLTGCVQGAFFPQVNTATARVLASDGCEVVIPRRQGCCGALSAHAGRAEEAARFARSTVAAFERAGVDVVVVNSAGCGSTMKHYADVLANAAGGDGWARRAERLGAKVRDVTEFLADLGPAAERHPLPIRAAYHDACHLSHGQGVREQPRDLLRAVPELELVDVANPDICCGSAGIYNLLRPEPAAELGRRKSADVRATGAPLLVAGNPGCALQIAAAMGADGEAPAVAHTVQVLDASIRGLPPAHLLGGRRGG
ncbi:(Fe-S)-binding protein [Marinitenerispora sediminis]|uniref:Glycolate oxidase iron-sulfur subunit n=1 Tax=Marinitenerispora sediminis TaxID=1931232 RepID=A0A368T567_9ACTN|nr:heterodisulfide reductase-related iron-sulfur binding cluster [Marinitenerispora sediminis]RCV50064.1 glycolate oxidase [Marinitenerispora sediminis]RCV54000.1 glycolate oxidase [Marinitenerispora sediminis]RCV58773.1 glycolate oxidase [Marinitenerispora sediminis]